jgi:2',5'-phosphodiesterase
VDECKPLLGGFSGALDYIWADTASGAGGEGAAAAGAGRARQVGLRPVASMPLPPLAAVTSETALPSLEFPSDHLPMVADLEFVIE